MYSIVDAGCYCGANGCDTTKRFSYDAINQAKLVLQNLDFSFLMSDQEEHPSQRHIRQAINKIVPPGADIITPHVVYTTIDLQPEITFIDDCLEGMTADEFRYITFS